MRFLGTSIALIAAFLLHSTLSWLAPGWARFLDPFLLVVVYSGLHGGEIGGMLAGILAGWIQDIHFGGPVLGLSGLSKLLVGFFVGVAASRFHLGEPRARFAVLGLATLVDALLLQRLAAVFGQSPQVLSFLALVFRAVLTASIGAILFEAVGRRWGQRRRR